MKVPLTVTEFYTNELQRDEALRIIHSTVREETVIDEPIYRTVQRPWRERLLERPWRPWVATKLERDYAREFDLRHERLLARIRASRELMARTPADLT